MVDGGWLPLVIVSGVYWCLLTGAGYRRLFLLVAGVVVCCCWLTVVGGSSWQLGVAGGG